MKPTICIHKCCRLMRHCKFGAFLQSMDASLTKGCFDAGVVNEMVVLLQNGSDANQAL
jgi:hypothetical protein